MYVTIFTVRPTDKWSSFPLDMLRYDCCYPGNADAVAEIARHGEGPRERDKVRWESESITLHQRHPTVMNQLTPRRWESFGWEVLISTTRKV